MFTTPGRWPVSHSLCARTSITVTSPARISSRTWCTVRWAVELRAPPDSRHVSSISASQSR